MMDIEGTENTGSWQRNGILPRWGSESCRMAGLFNIGTTVKSFLAREYSHPSKPRRRWGKLSSPETAQWARRRHGLCVEQGTGVLRVNLQMGMSNVSVKLLRIVVVGTAGVRTLLRVRHRGKQRIAYPNQVVNSVQPPSKRGATLRYLTSSRVSGAGAGARAVL